MRRSEAWRRLGLRAVLGAGLFFLYAPIVSVILFSFNNTSSAAVWAGFSLRWYQELADNDDILRGQLARHRVFRLYSEPEFQAGRPAMLTGA